MSARERERALILENLELARANLSIGWRMCVVSVIAGGGALLCLAASAAGGDPQPIAARLLYRASVRTTNLAMRIGSPLTARRT